LGEGIFLIAFNPQSGNQQKRVQSGKGSSRRPDFLQSIRTMSRGFGRRLEVERGESRRYATAAAQAGAKICIRLMAGESNRQAHSDRKREIG
jgi:hypothetical protein